MKRKKILLSLVLFVLLFFSWQLVDRYKSGFKNLSSVDSNVTLPSGKKKVSSSPTLIPTPTPRKIVSRYKIHRDIIATFFWVGEGASFDNNFIANDVSAWDSNWVESYGGVDDPEERDGYFPKGFTPLENPFYVALPYSDFNENGRKVNLETIPWYKGVAIEGVSLIKNRWVKIYYEDKACFAQWENVGPNLGNDTAYVFGDAKPSNNFGLKAGIDVSPAVKDFLNMPSGSYVDWHFVDDDEVTRGPWTQVITTSNPNWDH
jgi:hypothetical protein